VRIRKKTATGTVDLASSFAYAWSYGAAMPLNGVADFCSKLTTTVSYAADGLTPITPVEGGCASAGQQLFWNLHASAADREHGRSTNALGFLLQYRSGREWRSGSAQVPYGSFSPTDPLTVYTTFADNTADARDARRCIKSLTMRKREVRNWTGSNYNYISRPSDYLTWVKPHAICTE
jgi:hypothetical protein